MTERLDIKRIFAKAKKILLEKGYHAPIILVETTNGAYMSTPDKETFNSGDALVKSAGFFLMGRYLAQEEAERAEDVTAVYLVTETWFAELNEEERRTGEFERPSTRTERREGIMVNAFYPNQEGKPQNIHTAEIIRPGGTIDLIERAGYVNGTVSSPLLPSFVEGMKSSGLPNAFTQQKIDRFMRTGRWS